MSFPVYEYQISPDANQGGIGPQDQLEVVQSSTDGPTMINETDWIILPVGNNLGDHLNVSRMLRANVQTALT